MLTGEISEELVRQLDNDDPLAAFKKEFYIADESVCYLDGNSLGRLPLKTISSVESFLKDEWGKELVDGWAHWIDEAQPAGDLLARAALGTGPGQTLVCDTTSVNLYQLCSAAIRSRPGRNKVLVDSANFPTDRYIVQGLAEQHNLQIVTLDTDGSGGPGSVSIDCENEFIEVAELEKHLNSRGLLMRFFGPIARRIDKSWKMYPLGILFGLGFDTATEIGLLVLAGSSVIAGLPWWAIISLPLFFAGGMSLLDTIDGSFMNFAYGWAFSKPVRKVYYNIIITGLSVAVALFVGGLEILQVIAQQLNLSGPFWNYALDFNLNSAGYFIVAAFAVVWGIALLIWRFGRIEERWHNTAHAAQMARGENTDHAAAGIDLGPIKDGWKID